jgi:transcriptional regulator with XRE-family HTH domain
MVSIRGTLMTKSKLKSRLSLARTTAGISQRKLAELSGVSLDHLKHLESGERKLSALHAGLFESCLYVSAIWLLGMDQDYPPRDINGHEYTKDTYRKYAEGKQLENINRWAKQLMLRLIEESPPDALPHVAEAIALWKSGVEAPAAPERAKVKNFSGKKRRSKRRRAGESPRTE